jgi:FAD/FMN-containing dehydrogenase
MACGGRGGIGTPLYGSLRDNTIDLTAVKVNGSTEVLSEEDVGLFCGSFGIYGVITELKIRIRKLEPGYKTFSFTFSDLKHFVDALTLLANSDKRPLYLKLADCLFQSYSNPIDKSKYVLTASYPEDSNLIPTDTLEKISSDLKGTPMSEEFASKEWDLRLDCEFLPKEHCESLMFQEILVDVDKAYDLLETFEKYRDTYRIPGIWSIMLGTGNELRVELMTLLNPDNYLKFISSKGILHKMIKKAIKLGGGPYTIGLQNSIYMEKAYPERLKFMKEVKEEWDTDNIMNPDRVTSCLTSYRRIDVLFNLAVLFRRLSKYIDREPFTGGAAK